MKKYFLVVLCAVVLFVVTGCGNKNQVVCEETATEGGVSMKAEIIVDFDDNDKLTDATAVYNLDSEETANQYCAFMKLAEDADKGVKVECSGKKITIKGFANVDQDEDEEPMIGMSKEDFMKKMAEEENVTCK